MQAQQAGADNERAQTDETGGRRNGPSAILFQDFRRQYFRRNEHDSSRRRGTGRHAIKPAHLNMAAGARFFAGADRNVSIADYMMPY
jgi:hypothetical protein